MGSRRAKKFISMLVIFTMIFTSSILSLADDPDIKGHWAEKDLTSIVEKGLLNGYPDGTIRPNNNITKVEFYAIINRLMGYKETAEINFADVKPEDWFYEEVAKGVKAGYIDDGEELLPNSNITRQEVCSVIGIVFELDKSSSNSADNFTDGDSIASWAKGYVSAMKDSGYISGYPDGTFRPSGLITRGEIARILTNTSGNIINAKGDYSEDVLGNVVVNTPNVTLKDMTIKGDLYLAEGIGDGDVTLDNIVVKGETHVRGGGENSIKIVNSKLGKVIVNKESGRVRVVLEGKVEILNIELNNDVKLVLKDGAVVKSIQAIGKANIDVEKGAEVGEIEVKAKDVEIKSEGKIEKVVAEKEVKVNNKTVKSGEEIKVENGKVEDLNKPDKPSTPSTPVSSGGGGGGSSSGGGGGYTPEPKPEPEPEEPKIVAVSAISVDPTTMTLAIGDTSTITAIVEPDNATNKRVTWTSSNESVATVDNGVVTPVAVGTATITATSNNGKTATTIVTVVEFNRYDFIGIENKAKAGYLNILKGSIGFKENEVILSIHLRDIPETLQFNKSVTPVDTLEYEWGVSIGISSSKGYNVSASHFKNKIAEPINQPIEEAVQVDVWKLKKHPSEDKNGGESLKNAQIYVDYDLNLIKITGTIENISKESIDYIKVFTKAYDCEGDEILVISEEADPLAAEKAAKELIDNKEVTVEFGKANDTEAVLAAIKALEEENTLIQALTVDAIEISGGTATVTFAVGVTAEVTVTEAADPLADEKAAAALIEGKTVEVAFEAGEDKAAVLAAIKALEEENTLIQALTVDAIEISGGTATVTFAVGVTAEVTVTEAAEALAEAKTAATAALDEYVDAEDYKTNAEALATAIAAGKEAIDAAATTDAVASALADAKSAIDEIKTDAQLAAEALAAINDYLTTESYVYADAPAALEPNLTILGLEIGDGSDYAKLETTEHNRKTAVFSDLNDNKPAEGYDLATLTTYFNAMVGTRLKTQESMDKVNSAESVEALDGISWVTRLNDHFASVTYATHSGKAITEKKAELQGLVTRYNALDADKQLAALTQVWNGGTDYARSQATTDALAAAIADQESIVGEVTAALKAVNEAASTAEMQAAIEGKAAVLGLDMTSYNALLEARRPAVSVDLVANKGEGYTVDSLKTTFDAIVATRHATQDSMDKVNSATSAEALGMTWVTELLAQFKSADEVYDYHSGILLADKASALQELVNRYEALPKANKAAVLVAVWNNGEDYARSQATTDALAAAIADQESIVGEVTAALDAVNNAGAFVSDANHPMRDAIEANATVLGLATGEGNTYYGLVDGRKRAVNIDLFDNKPEGGYNLETLQVTFDEIVATRLVFEESVALFAGATETNPLTDLTYITMLITNLESVQKQTKHSGKSIEGVILPELKGLEADFNALTPEQKKTVLKDMNYSATTSSTATRNALRASIAKVLADAVTTVVDLEMALADETITEITVDGTLGTESDYTVYNVNRTVTIKGTTEAKVYGTFIVKADGVVIDGLAIQNKGDLTGESTTNRGGIYVFAEKITLTNNTITNGLGENAGLSNAIQIMSPKADNPLSNYVITGNSLIGHDNEVPNWSSSGIVIAQGYSPGSIGGAKAEAITASAANYQSLLNNNTFTNNKIDLTHQDWSKSGDEVVLYPYPVDETKADVANLAELTTALADENIKTINIETNIEATEPVVVNRVVTINGGSNTLSFTGLEAITDPNKVDDGLIIQAAATINNLKVDAGLTTPSTWVGTYAIHVYNTTATLNDVTATKGNGGILVNGSAVTLTGAIDVTGNGFGGIEVSIGEDLTNTSLNVTGAALTNTSEAYGLPTIWEDKVTGKVTGGAFIMITKGSQPQYYLVEANSKAPNEEQSAPTGLTGVAPTSALNDGKITGTTEAMEYKLASAEDSAYAVCTAYATTVAVAGDYVVRLAVKEGFNASPTTAVTVPAYVAPEQVATPVITLSKTTATNREVGVTFAVTAVDGVTFYYTVDGSAPTVSSTEYTSKVTLTAPENDAEATITIKVIGVKDGSTDSEVATSTVTYTAKQ